MRVVVLMGGPSAEREVSLVTGAAVSGALERLGHDVARVDLSPAGFESLGGDAAAPGLIRPDDTSEGAPGHLAFLSIPQVRRCDAVFIALHGGVGEDGRVQAALDLAGIPYTGSGSLASALAMNKDISKRIFVERGIPTPRWTYCRSPRASGKRGGGGWREAQSQPRGSALGEGAPRAGETSSRAAVGPGSSKARATAAVPDEVEGLVGFPVVVKPNDQGSTIGLTVVQEEGGLSDAFNVAAAYSEGVIVESYVPGRELTVSVLDGRALPVIEIIPEGGLYDYTRKYVKGKSRYVVPAELDRATAGDVESLSLRAFNALGCRGFGRVDLRLSPEGKPFCLEVNTVPGMTETSLVPMAAAAVDISFDRLVERILASASTDAPRRGGVQ